ncbi:MAG TPA: prepilin peptidase [Burkholderiales bacterium]|nr:prepilin peptidase [Burkholderiales bacterium]
MLPVPGIVLGVYPERRTGARDPVEALLAKAKTFLPVRAASTNDRFIAAVNAHSAALEGADEACIAERVVQIRARLARHGLADDLVAEAFALVSRTCARTLSMQPFATQLIAARVMLRGALAEMATGEGKTLAAGLCAATAALAGIPIHVITANDYLVARDAKILEPLYSALGLTVAAVTGAVPPHERRPKYDCDIVYCTASELVFDYLRDGLTRKASRGDLFERAAAMASGKAAARKTVLRGLCMALVDEADSVLIDDARVPLILSERVENAGEQRYLKAALDAARRLVSEKDFTLHRGRMAAELTPAGADALDAMGGDGAWKNRLHRDETVCTALAALHLYEQDRHYLVRRGEVTIIDESTGRLAVGRVWSRGLHRLIELKEGLEAGIETATVAQITYQRFFKRYLRLGGMSGTLAEARAELASVYGLEVTRIPLGRPALRVVLPTRLYPDRETQWQAVVQEAIETARTGRPVLIGTDSVAESEALSRRLAQVGQPHAVLNARQDSSEAEIIAAAGQPGRITVATNMAGRGTDIELGPEVAARGGLHVICCQHNVSRRIDRQLVGRCARRGDPGSVRTLLSVDKPLIAKSAPRFVARRVTAPGLERPQRLVRFLVTWPQRIEERRQRNERRELLKRDTHAERALSFGAAKE